MIYPNYYQQMQNQNVAYQPNYYQQQNQQPIVQNNDFIDVASEQEARNYPIAPGTGLKFRNVNAPYIYEKIMGFSQFEQPTFTKYRLIREDEEQAVVEEQVPQQQIEYATFDDITRLKHDIKDLQLQINRLKPREVAKYDE